MGSDKGINGLKIHNKLLRNYLNFSPPLDSFFHTQKTLMYAKSDYYYHKYFSIVSTITENMNIPLFKKTIRLLYKSAFFFVFSVITTHTKIAWNKKTSSDCFELLIISQLGCKKCQNKSRRMEVEENISLESLGMTKIGEQILFICQVNLV